MSAEPFGAELQHHLLERIKVGAQAALMAGLLDVDVEIVRDMFSDALLARLTAYVLADQGGEPATDSVTVYLSVPRKVKPRLFPKWMWRRVREETVNQTQAVTLTARPMWTYPSSHLSVPALGQPVRIVLSAVERHADDPFTVQERLR